MSKSRAEGQDPLAVAPHSGTLGRHAARGGAFAIGGQIVRIGVQLGVAAVLSRLLEPRDFGLFAMANTLIAFVGLFSDLGVSGVTLQRAEIDHALVSTLFYLNVLMGLVVMAVALAAAPLLGWFYVDPRIVPMAASMALTFPIAAAGSQHITLLQRQMRWGALQVIWLTPQAVGGAVAVILAWKTGVGYWALVAQVWITTLLSTALAWILSSWRPAGWRGLKRAGNALSFGLPLTGASLMNYFHRQLDNVLIGWRWGASNLGQYTRAYSLLTAPLGLFAQPVGSAVVPALCKLQDEPQRWADAYTRALGALNLVSVGMAAMLVASAEPLVKLIYGPQWGTAGGIFLLLAISMFSATPVNACGWAYFSFGRPERLLHWTLTVTPFYVLAFVIGLPYGAKGVALCYSLAMAVSVLPCFYFQVRWMPLQWSALIRAWLPATVAGIVAALLALQIVDMLPPKGALFQSFFAVALAGMFYAVGLSLLTVLRLIDNPFGLLRSLRG